MSGTIDSGLAVPAGSVCTIEEASIVGSVTAKPGAFLPVFSAEVRGALIAPHPDFMIANGATMSGSVSVVGATGSTEVAQLRDVRQRRPDRRRSDGVELNRTVVHRMVDVSRNTATNVVIVAGNAIGTALPYAGNTLRPTNAVNGDILVKTAGRAAVGQCEGL